MVRGRRSTPMWSGLLAQRGARAACLPLSYVPPGVCVNKRFGINGLAAVTRRKRLISRHLFVDSWQQRSCRRPCRRCSVRYVPVQSVSNVPRSVPFRGPPSPYAIPSYLMAKDLRVAPCRKYLIAKGHISQIRQFMGVRSVFEALRASWTRTFAKKTRTRRISPPRRKPG